MRLKKVVKTMACCLAVSFSMCIGLLGGVGTITTYAQENGEEAIGEAIAVDEQTLDDSQIVLEDNQLDDGFVDQADMVDASYEAVTAKYDFDTAYEILRILNEERKAAGLSTLTMDKDLMEAAMFRGGEISVSFSHTRPNGQRCFTICNKAYGENIAYGYKSASSVMQAWMESEGHRDNILDSRYSTVGIGVAVVDGSINYVQLFGIRNLVTVPSKPSNQTVAINVPLTSDSPVAFPVISYGGNTTSKVPEYTDSQTVFPTTDITSSYRTHVESFGWSGVASDRSDWEKNGGISGTLGLSKRLEGIEIKLSGNDNLGIRYRTHIESIGWESQWKADGQMSGTSGRSLRLEAIQIELTGSDSSKYDVYYRVHAESYGWLGWAKNGECAGTAGQSKRLEAIQIAVVPKGTYPSGIIGYSYVEVGKYADNGTHDGKINYSTHVEKYGDQLYVYDGSVSGTFGESKRLEAIRINVNNDLLGMEGGVRYTTHVEKYGWQQDISDSSKWCTNGQPSGTSGESKRLEAICIELYGDVAQQYDVYYRVHAEHFGWLGWAKNGAPAGTAGYSKRLEGIQIVLLPKGSAAPSTNPGKAGTSPYIAK